MLWPKPESGVPPGAEPGRALNPAISWHGALDGRGWDHFDERAPEWGIVRPDHSAGPEV